MRTLLMWAALGAALSVAEPSAAQDGPAPGVTDVAPGVRVVDGAKVPSTSLDAAALDAAITAKKSLRAVRGLLGGNGITSEGPSGTMLRMYKVRDTVTGKGMVVVLFVKGDEIVEHLIQ
jgi:hypothetical protein